MAQLGVGGDDSGGLGQAVPVCWVKRPLQEVLVAPMGEFADRFQSRCGTTRLLPPGLLGSLKAAY